MLGYYTFDNSDATDSSGNGANGTLGVNSSFAVGQGVDGETAAQFTVSGSSDFISVPIDMNPGLGPDFTIAGWFLVDDNAGVAMSRMAVSHDNGGFDRTIALDTRTGTSTTRGAESFAAFGGPTTGVVPSSDDFDRPGDLGEWFFVAVTYREGVPDGSTLYVANQDLTQFSIDTFTADNGDGFDNTAIGGTYRYPTQDWDGLIDNVGFYGRALTEREVRNYAISSSISTVPLPAAAPMLMVGLAGLYLGARRRRKS
ncbi:MAG: LamG-like jellyroll fold domain-containing protein [Pseudomonadota bacterium]